MYVFDVGPYLQVRLRDNDKNWSIC